MKREIERKFLVKNTEFLKESGSKQVITQGYLSKELNKVVRIRAIAIYYSIFFIESYINSGIITIKTKTDEQDGVDEFEYSIPNRDAEKLLQSCAKPLIEKTRYRIQFEDTLWEVDVFHGHKEGLIMAEVEVDAMSDPIDIPSWIGEEVTGKSEYSNSNM